MPAVNPTGTWYKKFLSSLPSYLLHIINGLSSIVSQRYLLSLASHLRRLVLGGCALNVVRFSESPAHLQPFIYAVLRIQYPELGLSSVIAAARQSPPKKNGKRTKKMAYRVLVTTTLADPTLEGDNPMPLLGIEVLTA